MFCTTNELLAAEPTHHFWSIHHVVVLDQVLKEPTMKPIARSYALIIVSRFSTTRAVVISAVPEKGDMALMREGYFDFSKLYHSSHTK